MSEYFLFILTWPTNIYTACVHTKQQEYQLPPQYNTLKGEALKGLGREIDLNFVNMDRDLDINKWHGSFFCIFQMLLLQKKISAFNKISLRLLFGVNLVKIIMLLIGQGSRSILFYSILFYSILFYSILFYSILFYSILFYSILF